ncbi:MAG: flagellar FlbD family protein [Solirubrobacteraceae bacterium]|nr:flagellar FlbD family protein [Solirubrobacteraceae bacterium]
MITLHRLGRESSEVVLNADLICTVEAHPDTVLTLVTGARIVVEESPTEVIAAVLEWRAEIGRSTFIAPTNGSPTPLKL